MFGKLKKPQTWKCRTLHTAVPVSARQEMLPGWNQSTYAETSVLLTGAGGLNGEICEGLVRKGIGTIHVSDHDIVTSSNLHRQKFLEQSLYRNKATELCRIMRLQGFLGTHLVAHPNRFQEIDSADINPDLGVCGVDNQFPETRLEVCKKFDELARPLVVMAVGIDADYGYVAVQEPDKACWACIMKPELSSHEGESARCPNVPAIIDILKALAGPALYAIDSLVFNRPRDWNYRVISLSSGFGGSHFVEKRPDCPVCGNSNSNKASQERESR